MNTRENRIGVELYLTNEKAYFFLLKERQAEIEGDIGAALDWQELPDRQASRIVLYKSSSDPTDETDWPNQHTWIAEMLERFNSAFRQRVKILDASDWIPDDAETTLE